MKKTLATPPKIKTITEKVLVFRNVALEGNTLKVEKVITTFEKKQQIRNQVDKVVTPMSFNLIEVTAKELTYYRQSEIPSFVLKVDGKLYYTRIPRSISFVSCNILGRHKCSISRFECRRLSAASDDQGGCEKVRNKSKCIERYPWITNGFETFNTDQDAMVVAKCHHYKKCPPQRRDIL